jgi:hypothetical protein
MAIYHLVHDKETDRLKVILQRRTLMTPPEDFLKEILVEKGDDHED